MRLRRRQALAAVAVTALGLTPKVFGQTAAGNRKGSVRLIDRKAKAYRIPAWFQEGKFGIWATFGGRNRAFGDGDWYAATCTLASHSTSHTSIDSGVVRK
jgi:hypothetical protein